MPTNLHSGHRERLRTRYAKTGGDDFLDYQYLELLLTYAIPRRDTNELAHKLLQKFGSLENVFQADTHVLMSVEGIGASTALFLHMQSDLLKRIRLNRLRDTRGQILLNTPYASANYAYVLLCRCAYETVQIVCLNTKRFVTHTEILQNGTLSEAHVYPRNIAEIALVHHAHSVIIMHNHPSGDPTPSSEDANTTQAVRTALAGIDIQLADHLVVGGAFVFSFAADVLLDLSMEPPATLSLEDYGTYRREPQLQRVMESY